MIKELVRLGIAVILISSSAFASGAERDSVQTPERQLFYSLSVQASATPVGENTPFYHHSLMQGVSSLTPNNGNLRASLFLPTQKGKKFTIGGGLDLVGAYNHYKPFMVQQAYVDMEWRIFDLMIGAKEYWGEMRNVSLSTGGTTWSGNSRPIPQVRAGIFNYVMIPKIPVQIRGYIAYGKYMDSKWSKDNFNYWNNTLSTDVLYHQKAVYFRSPEKHPFRFTWGIECVTTFGGNIDYYSEGNKGYSFNEKLTFKSFLNALVPIGGGGETASPMDRAFIYGSNLGCYNLNVEYEFRDKSVIKAYYEDMYNDTGGLIFVNQGDGLWGIEWNNSPSKKYPLVKDVLVEFFKTTSQSGMVHWRESDAPGYGPPPPPGDFISASGQDDYYNNYERPPHSHYGQISGNPLVLSPIYNKDGILVILNNRILGYHIGVNGYLLPELKYRLLTTYRKGWGNGRVPLPFATEATSSLVECTYQPQKLKGWEGTLSVGFDLGNMVGQNLGVLIGVRKTGSFTLLKKTSK